MTSVVNLYHQRYDVYIGRAGQNRDGYFGNPHSVVRRPKAGMEVPCKCGKYHSLPEVLELYKEYFSNRIEQDETFRSRVEELRGLTLGCFCRPKEGFQGRLLCHGQIVAGWLDGIPPEQVL